MEFAIDDRQYRTNRKLNAFEQLHIARKLAPLISKLSPTAQNPDANDFFSLMAPVIEGLAEMTADDVDFITQKCASVVQCQQSLNTWAPIWHEGAKRLMFDEIDAMALLTISFHVIQDNLSNFMRALPSISRSPIPTTTDSQGNLSAFPTAKVG